MVAAVVTARVFWVSEASRGACAVPRFVVSRDIVLEVMAAVVTGRGATVVSIGVVPLWVIKVVSAVAAGKGVVASPVGEG